MRVPQARRVRKPPAIENRPSDRRHRFGHTSKRALPRTSSSSISWIRSRTSSSQVHPFSRRATQRHPLALSRPSPCGGDRKGYYFYSPDGPLHVTQYIVHAPTEPPPHKAQMNGLDTLTPAYHSSVNVATPWSSGVDWRPPMTQTHAVCPHVLSRSLWRASP